MYVVSGIEYSSPAWLLSFGLDGEERPIIEAIDPITGESIATVATMTDLGLVFHPGVYAKLQASGHGQNGIQFSDDGSLAIVTQYGDSR